MSLFQLFQPPLEIAGLDRPDKNLDHPGQLGRLAGRDRARSGRGGNGRHRAAEIGGHCAPAAVPAALAARDAAE